MIPDDATALTARERIARRLDALGIGRAFLLRYAKKAFRDAYGALVLRLILAAQVRAMRRARGWSQSELAERAGISHITVIRVECGLVGTLRSLLGIAQAFDCALRVALVSHGEFLEFVCDALEHGPAAPQSWTEEHEALTALLPGETRTP